MVIATGARLMVVLDNARDMVEIDYDLQRCKNGTAAVISVPNASDSSPASCEGKLDP